MTPVLKTAELAFLAIISYKKLTKKILGMYATGTKLFTNNYCPHLCLLFSAFQEALQKFKQENGNLNISKTVLAASLADAVAEDKTMPDQLVEKCDFILKSFTDGNNIPSYAEGATLIDDLIALDTTRKIGYAIATNPGIEELQNILDKSKNASDCILEDPDAIVEDPVFCTPLTNIDQYAIYTTRIPTGINWFDALTNGGGRGEELWLLLASSGFGKTALTVQYSIAQAMLGRDTVWATYEQSLQGDLAERIVANVTDESLDIIRDKGFNNLPENLKEKYRLAISGTAEKLTVLDMTKKGRNESDPEDDGGLYSVWKYVKKLKAKGHDVRTVLIDWFGAMMDIVAANTGKDLANGYRFIANNQISIARKMAKEEDLQIIFFHQTDSKSQSQKPTYIPDKTCSKDMKDMAHYMDVVITFGNRDTHGVCYAHTAKSRKGAPITETIRLIGDKSKFVPAVGWIPYRDGNFYNPREDSQLNNNQGDRANNAAIAYSREVD